MTTPINSEGLEAVVEKLNTEIGDAFTAWFEHPRRMSGDTLDLRPIIRTALEASNITGMREALEAARDKFLEYAEIHSAKLPSEYRDAPANWKEIAEKVERNREMAAKCSKAIGVAQ